MQCGPWRSIIFLHRVPPTANPQIQCLGRCFCFKPGFESVCFWMFFEFLSKLCKGSELLQKVVNTSQFWCRISHVFGGVGSGQLFKHVSRTGIQIELRFVTTVFLFYLSSGHGIFGDMCFGRHELGTRTIGMIHASDSDRRPQ